MSDDLRGITWDHPRGYAPLRAFGGGVSWDVRPVEDFEARPLRELAAGYDLMVIDHPGLGAAIADGALLALNELFAPSELARWRTATVGRTWESYTMGGRQWALPIDASTQVSVYRPDRVDRVPERWADVAGAVRTVPSALCLGGPHAMLMWLSMRRDADALRLLRDLWPHVDRAVSLGGPIAIHDALDAGAIAYCPLAYQYVGYSHLAWANAPDVRGVLGGGGLAVSAATRNSDALRTWVRAFLAPDVQTGLVPENGGQPAVAAYWKGRSTTRSLREALIRPRGRGWIAVQQQGSEIVREAVIAGLDAEKAAAELARLLTETHDRL
ncbi:extracellular solute-binding protein [Actinoplanes sp. NBRC 103695]|uniref:extracellular solute-binding protein n=1 Tax=Actinoplanes sp. NBRC 103695 TaxID=3032202 RepID=UPI0024A290D7|nr:extracellular solute-binding protein [Actinoplanes sp. NBRC 103695]GLZ00741.1 membrane protein [Actinoplanes sp. NBRC 103695]